MSTTSKANAVVFWAIVAILALTPVPIASNRPFFWALNGLVVATIALGYFAALRGNAARLRIPLGSLGLASFLYVLAICWMIVQVIPLPAGLAPSFPWEDAGKSLAMELPATISTDAGATLGMIMRFITYGLLFGLVLQVTANPDRARGMIKAAFWITVAHAGIAIVLLLELGDQLLIFPKWAYHGFATGFFVNRNSFATFAAFGATLGVALALDPFVARRGRAKSAATTMDSSRTLLVFGTGIAILITAIVLSASRMGALVAAVGVLTVFAIAFFLTSGRRSGVAAGLAMIVVLIAGASLLYGGRLADRVGSLETLADDRLLLYEQVIDMIQARPWTGFGAGTFTQAFPMFHQLPLSADVTWDAAHNLYLEMLADLGIPAIALLIAALAVFIRLVGSLSSPAVNWLAPASAAGVMVVAAIHSMVDFSLQIEANALIFTAIVATGTAQALSASSQQRRRVSPASSLSTAQWDRMQAPNVDGVIGVSGREARPASLPR